MILHVTFSDGSNPWVSLPADRYTIAKQWRNWEKRHPDTAQPCACLNGWLCEYAKNRSCIWVYNEKLSAKHWKRYKRLGSALAALERLGAGK